MSQSSDDEDFQRDSQSQFVSQDDDDELLWEVVEITDEKAKHYKVRWAGIDPSTKKPWAQSWVLKADCTDDLVHEWKRKKAQKKKKSATGSRLSGVSRVSRTTRSSTDTDTPSTATKESVRTSNVTAVPLGSPQFDRKRTRNADSMDDAQYEDEAILRSERPKKKRKITVSRGTVVAGSRAGKRKKVSVSDEDDDLEDKVLYMPEIEESRRSGMFKIPAEKKEEEEESEDDDGTARIEPTTSRAQSQTTDASSPLPQHTPPLEPTPEPDLGYVKFKSGKLSTPNGKKRRSSESPDDPSSSSDEAELVVPVSQPQIQPTATPPPPPSPPNHPHTSPPPESSHVELRDDEEQLVEEMYNEYVDFDAGHPQPKTGGPASTQSNEAKDDSFRQGVVPETETESSNNTQSQSQSKSHVQPSMPRQRLLPTLQPDLNQGKHKGSAGPQKTRVPPKPLRVPTEILTPHATPGRSSLISKMKPRTPGSSSRISLFDDSADIIFRQPELEVHPEVDEDQEETGVGYLNLSPRASSSSIDDRTTSGQLRPIPRLSPSQFTAHLPKAASGSSIRHHSARTATEDDIDAAEIEELVSSIEQFSSPEKGGNRRRAVEMSWRKGKGKAKEVMEGARSGAQGSATEGEDSDAEQLEEVVQLRGQQLAERSREERVKRQREYDGEQPNGKRRTLNDLLSVTGERNGRERRHRELENKGTDKLRRMKQASGAWWEKKSTRKRSSRSQSLQEYDASQENMEVDTSDAEPMDNLREEEEESTQDLMMEAAEMRPMEDVGMGEDWVAEPSAILSDEVAEQETQRESRSSSPRDQTASGTRSRSSLNSVRSFQRIPSKETLILPPTAPIPSPPAIESQEADHNPDFVATLALLNEKSQENIQLTKEISALREALAAAQAIRPPESGQEQEQPVTWDSLEAAKELLVESEKRAVELARGKESAEKDRELFRDLYAKASGFVTGVREENAQLKEEADIAKEQAKTGVEMVKATFMARVKALEDDVKTYKRLALFIMEKDVRTNDDIRRRAGEEPELRARCGELAKDNRILKTQLDKMKDDLAEKKEATEELELELSSWKNQLTTLNADLCKLKSRLEGNDTVYLCHWRIDDDVNEPCGQVFTTQEDFQVHMMSAKHLGGT
ncbi:hypothetical protein H0H87_003974 [Tephrocybe sp. NHM501043]|nr:hypothetical protein H0H87_003974 [Tephrocybe sp. NHM501043]